MSLYKRIDIAFTLVRSYTTRELKVVANDLGVPVNSGLVVIRREVAERLFNPTSMDYDVTDLMIREHFDD
jgi:hypothetical protein